MKLLTKDLLQKLLSDQNPPCLSLYMPTHRNHPENKQDPIRFKTLLKSLEEYLLKKYEAREVENYLKPFEKLYRDQNFWDQALDGIAVFSSDSLFEKFTLPIHLEELTIVADSFHVKPLFKYFQSVDRYHVLGLTLNEIELYEGNRHSVEKLDLPDDFPKTMVEALGEELTDDHLTVASYGGNTGGDNAGMHHGHGSKKDQVEIDAQRFFRVVADSVYENYSKPSGLPLVLAALAEHHSLFQKVNKNPFLLSNGISGNPKSIPKDQLKDRSWKVIEPEYLKKLNQYAETFNQAKANGRGTDDHKEAAEAAMAGKIDILLVEADRIIKTPITSLVGDKAENESSKSTMVDDLLDDMGELVTKMGGKVVVMPPERMPVDTGLAAIYRY